MTSAARQLAVVRRAAFGKLPSGEPTYHPPIQHTEILDMREALRFATALSSDGNDGDGEGGDGSPGAENPVAPLGSITARHVALFRRAKFGDFPAGTPEPEFEPPITLDEIEEQREDIRMWEALAAARAQSATD